jgi:hypothetical protein
LLKTLSVRRLTPYATEGAIENQSITRIEVRAIASRKLFRPAQRDNATRALRACLSFLAKLDVPDANTIRLRGQLKSDVEIFGSVFFPA